MTDRDKIIRDSMDKLVELAVKDHALLERALGILHRMATENTGWRTYYRRWYYPDEPLRNDAANLVREAGFAMAQPEGTRLVGDRP